MSSSTEGGSATHRRLNGRAAMSPLRNASQSTSHATTISGVQLDLTHEAAEQSGADDAEGTAAADALPGAAQQMEAADNSRQADQEQQQQPANSIAARAAARKKHKAGFGSMYMPAQPMNAINRPSYAADAVDDDATDYRHGHTYFR